MNSKMNCKKTKFTYMLVFVAMVLVAVSMFLLCSMNKRKEAAFLFDWLKSDKDPSTTTVGPTTTAGPCYSGIRVEEDGGPPLFASKKILTKDLFIDSDAIEDVSHDSIKQICATMCNEDTDCAYAYLTYKSTDTGVACLGLDCGPPIPRFTYDCDLYGTLPDIRQPNYSLVPDDSCSVPDVLST